MKNFNRQMFTTTSDVSKSLTKQTERVGVEKKYWIERDGKDYLYKQDDEKRLGFGELLCSHLANIIGFECVNSYPATNSEQGTKGVMVESFLNNSVFKKVTMNDIVKEVDGHYWDMYGRYSIEEFLRLEKKLNRQKLYFSPDLVSKLKQMVLVDYMLGQVDRHQSNIEFLIYQEVDTKKMYITPAPMFDNGRILGMASDTGMFTVYLESCMAPPKLTISSRQDGPQEYVTESVAVSILKEMERDENLKELYQKFLQIDMAKEIDYVCAQAGYDFSEKEKEHMVDYFKARIEIINRLTQEKQDYPKEFEYEHKKHTARFLSLFPNSWKKLITKYEKKVAGVEMPRIMKQEHFEKPYEIAIARPVELKVFNENVLDKEQDKQL